MLSLKFYNACALFITMLCFMLSLFTPLVNPESILVCMGAVVVIYTYAWWDYVMVEDLPNEEVKD